MNFLNPYPRATRNRHTCILLGIEDDVAYYVPMADAGLAVAKCEEQRFLEEYCVPLTSNPAQAATLYLQTTLRISALCARVLAAVAAGNPVTLTYEEIEMSTNDTKAAGAAIDAAVKKATANAPAAAPKAKAAAKGEAPAKAAKAKAAPKAKAAAKAKSDYSGKKIKALVKENPCRAETWSHFMLQAILDGPTTDDAQKKIDRNKDYGTGSENPRRADFGWAVAKGYVSLS